MSSERGFTLLETAIAIAILGILAVAFFSAQGTAIKSTIITDKKATAQSLAQSQTEYIKAQYYNGNGTYQRINIATIPSGYTLYGYNETVPALFGRWWSPISNNFSDNETFIQKITVTIKYGGSGNFSLESYKAE